MRYGSVCSGIEAATVAWEPLGWQPVFFSEIENFPCKVLEHHYPHVPNLGDLNNFEEWNIDGTVDLIVGGTPCQAFSVAGRRLGLDDERGNLALQFVRLIDRQKPRWIVWENVPGVLSSNGGNDFYSFIEALRLIGYGFCWRILDAASFGVPQRRRRVFLVGYYGDVRPAAAVLFEQESMRGDIKKSSRKRPGLARCLTTRYQRNCANEETYVVERVFENHLSDARYSEVTGPAPTVTARYGTGGNNVPLVTYALAENIIGRQDHNGSNGKGFKFTEMYTLNSTGVHGISDLKGVRRLTPRECERLQGFPDDYTKIIINNREPGDAPRYKAIGNSMAVPVMRWIGQRIDYVDSMLELL